MKDQQNHVTLINPLIFWSSVVCGTTKRFIQLERISEN